MALRQLTLSREAARLRSESETLAAAMQDIEARRAAWRERESRAEAALEEMTDETPEADRAAFDAECAEIQTEDEAITADENANTTRQTEIAGRLAEIDRELEDLNKRARNTQVIVHESGKEREGIYIMNKRTKEIRERMLAASGADGVRAFGQEIIEMQRRGVNNAEYSVPTELLPLLQEMIDGYSKLKKYMATKTTSGESRQNFLLGTPEAVWTENKASLNELDLSFGQVTIDAYKVGGFIPIHNSTIDDVENISAIALDLIAQSIAIAEDKAMLFGDGVKRPVGIATRLAATTKPAWWGEEEGEFVNLKNTHTGHVSTAGIEGIALFQEIMGVLGNAEQKYNASSEGLFWAMTRQTWMKLEAHLLGFNSAGALVSGMNMQMPLIGGDIVIMNKSVMKDNDIIGGYGSMYMWGDRTGVKLKVADQTRALQDQTVFIGTQRADGRPKSGEGFAAFSLSTEGPTLTATFAEDKANQGAEAASEEEDV